uniref:Uncharacterized protein n=1 Tax=Arundo donax TaxID=35708 RepID=A0A0A8Y3V8_ARUDO
MLLPGHRTVLAEPVPLRHGGP